MIHIFLIHLISVQMEGRRCMCVCVCELTVILDRSAINAAAESWLLTEGWCPAAITVAVPITVTYL